MEPLLRAAKARHVAHSKRWPLLRQRIRSSLKTQQQRVSRGAMKAEPSCARLQAARTPR